MSVAPVFQWPDPLPETVLLPVRAHAFEACVERLGTAIRLGVYPRGAALPKEHDLAKRLQVSRATLREALAAMREAGLIETTRGRGGGTFVTIRPRTPSARAAARISLKKRREWLDALEYRRIVEPGAAALAASRELTEEQTLQLHGAHVDVREPRSAAEHRQADSRFHLTIASLTGSARTIESVTTVQSALHEMLLAIPVLEANLTHSHAQHEELLWAVLGGKPEVARSVMEEHCDDTAALLRGLVG